MLSSQLVTLVLADGSPLGGPLLSFANGIWIDRSVTLKPAFKNIVENSYRAASSHVDFQNQEKLYNWILRQQEHGVRVMSGDILAYLQNELDYGTEEPPPSPRLPLQQQAQQQPNNLLQLPQTGLPISSNAFGPATIGQGLRAGNSDQSKNSVFSNALSSPVRRTLQHYQLSQDGFSSNNATRSNENSTNQNRDTNPLSSNDTSMDMHADSPSDDSPY